VLGEHAGALRVAVSAAPEKGKANDAIEQVLAEALGCKPSQVGILRGETSRTKSFLIAELDLEEVRKRVEELLAKLERPDGS
jgi:uncharacterized protein YggU (UPF0235/DUF167 family)